MVGDVTTLSNGKCSVITGEDGESPCPKLRKGVKARKPMQKPREQLALIWEGLRENTLMPEGPGEYVILEQEEADYLARVRFAKAIARELFYSFQDVDSIDTAVRNEVFKILGRYYCLYCGEEIKRAEKKYVI